MRWAPLAVACLLLGAFLKLPEAVEVPGSDTGMFATYGNLLLHGARPYLDFWDLHPPLVYAYWALVQAVSGGDWARTCLAVSGLAPQSCTSLLAHSLDLLLSVATALAVAAIVKRTSGATAAVIAALCVVGFADQTMLSQEGSNPSKLTLLPSSLAVLAYLISLDSPYRTHWAWAGVAGVAGALAVLAKQPALLTLGVLVGHALLHRDRSRLLGLVAGSVLVGVVVCAILAVYGSLQAFVAEAWIYNVQRVLDGYFVNPPKQPVIGLSRVLLESAGPLALLAALGVVIVARTPLDTRQRLLLAWALVNVVAITALREFVYVVPSFAAVAALGLERIWRWPRVGAQPLRHVALVALCSAFVLVSTGFQRVELARARYERGPGSGPAVVEKLGGVVRRDFLPGPLFVYGNGAELYALSARPPATRYVNAEALRTSSPWVDQSRADLVAALSQAPPPVVALAPHSDEAELRLVDFVTLEALLGRCYTPAPIRPEVDPGWTILLRTSACAPA